MPSANEPHVQETDLAGFGPAETHRWTERELGLFKVWQETKAECDRYREAVGRVRGLASALNAERPYTAALIREALDG